MEKTAKIFLASDHRGFFLKSEILSAYQNAEDLGPFSFNPNDDYNDFAVKIAQEILKNPGSFGILICGSAIGVSIQANRFIGIRAAIVDDEKTARLSREHNDANIICLSSEKFEKNPKNAIELINIFLKTPFSNESRHIRRIQKLDFKYDSEESE